MVHSLSLYEGPWYLGIILGYVLNVHLQGVQLFARWGDKSREKVLVSRKMALIPPNDMVMQLRGDKFYPGRENGENTPFTRKSTSEPSRTF